MSMKSSHKRFIQSFLSKGMLNVSEVKDLYIYCIKESEDRDCTDVWTQEIGSFVIHINNHITPIGQEIKKGLDEETGQHYYALINTRESDVSRLFSAYTPSQMNFVKKLIQQIVEEEEGSIGSTHALNLPLDEGVKDINKTEKEALLRTLEHNRWIKNKEGRISLSGRCVLELEPYIKDQFPDAAQSCRLCKKLCVQAMSCERCDTRLHVYCARKYYMNAGKLLCPNSECQVPWLHHQLFNASQQATDTGSTTQEH